MASEASPPAGTELPRSPAASTDESPLLARPASEVGVTDAPPPHATSRSALHPKNVKCRAIRDPRSKLRTTPYGFASERVPDGFPGGMEQGLPPALARENHPFHDGRGTK